MATKRAPGIKRRQKALIVKALTDPKFRALLKTNPEKALGYGRFNPVTQKEIDITLSMVRGIEAQISALADELLCAIPPEPCGIA